MIVLVLVAFLLNIVPVYAQSSLVLPAPGQMVQLSKPFAPTSLKGLKIDPKNPMRFDFILSQGQIKTSDAQLKDQGMDLVKYFLAALTLPENDVWVNLSPYEKDRIIPEPLSVTLMGRDMLAQDYLLKQITSSLLYPNEGVGQEFWKKVYSKAKSGYAGAQIPVSSFNKVWIMPDKAEVIIKDQTVIIAQAHLKVMLDHDYNAAHKVGEPNRIRMGQQEVAEDAMRDLIVPVLEKEINEGAHFAPLRQIFQAAILAEWYKRHFKQSAIGAQYANQHKVAGINETPTQFKTDLYQQYLQAYKKGVYNLIREDKDPETGEIIPRKYFSGGLTLGVNAIYKEQDYAQSSNDDSTKHQQPTQQQQSLHAGAYSPNEDLVSMQVELGSAFSAAKEYLRGLVNPYFTSIRSTFNGILEAMPNDLQLPSITEKILEQNVRVTSGWLTLEEGKKIFAVRVANNNLFGTPKGGIRWTKASDLMKNPEFVSHWNEFLQKNPTLQDGEDFIAKWLTQEANSLAIGMTLKTAGLGVELGGAKGDVFLGTVDMVNGKLLLNDLPNNWRSRVARAHAQQLTNARAIGINIDSPAPDVNTNPQAMAWYTDEMIKTLVAKGKVAFMAEVNKDKLKEFGSQYQTLYDQLVAIQSPKDLDQTPYIDTVYRFWRKNLESGNQIPMPWLGVFTGLAEDKGGVPGRDSATGEGVIAVVKSYLKAKGKEYAKMTVAIQGFGNVGSFTAIAAAREGFNVRVISDKNISLIKKDGFTVSELSAIAKAMKTETMLSLWQKGLIAGVEAVANTTDDKAKEKEVARAVLGADVDILIPAALQLQISTENVDDVKAKLIVEAANNPLYPEAIKILHKRGVDVIPGILANAGGVYVSGLQILQAATGRPLTLKEVTAKMNTTLGQSMSKLISWHNTVYSGLLAEAYNHLVLTALANRFILKEISKKGDAAMASYKVKREALIQAFPEIGAKVFDEFENRELFEAVQNGEGVFYRDHVISIYNQLGPLVGEKYKQVMQFILGAESEEAMEKLIMSPVYAADHAMAQNDVATNGGIDLNTSSMKINESGAPVQFDMSVLPKSMETIQGLVPVFIQMRPTTIPALLGY